MDTVYKCKEECISWGCVAFAYSYDNDYCDLYRNGPYTYGSGSKSTKCYIMPSGNIYGLFVNFLENIIQIASTLSL